MLVLHCAMCRHQACCMLLQWGDGYGGLTLTSLEPARDETFRRHLTEDVFGAVEGERHTSQVWWVLAQQPEGEGPYWPEEQMVVFAFAPAHTLRVSHPLLLSFKKSVF